MKDVQLKVTVDEINRILGALGNLPYLQVYELINKLKTQAEGQLKHLNEKDENLLVTSRNGGE
jgi:hypothetical protein